MQVVGHGERSRRTAGRRRETHPFGTERLRLGHQVACTRGREQTTKWLIVVLSSR